MKTRVDLVFRDFAFKAFGRKTGASPKVTKATAPVKSDEKSLAEMWGIKPVYTGQVIRRCPAMA